MYTLNPYTRVHATWGTLISWYLAYYTHTHTHVESMLHYAYGEMNMMKYVLWEFSSYFNASANICIAIIVLKYLAVHSGSCRDRWLVVVIPSIHEISRVLSGIPSGNVETGTYSHGSKYSWHTPKTHKYSHYSVPNK